MRASPAVRATVVARGTGDGLPVRHTVLQPSSRRPSGGFGRRADRDIIAAAIAASGSPYTAATYRSRWNHWTAWADSRGTAPLPTDPATVCACLTELADSKSVNTIKLAKAAIGTAHKRAGHDDPTARDQVAQALRGIARAAKVAGRGQATPLTYDQILQAQALATQPRKRGRGHELPHVADRRGLEDQAILGIGFMGGLRRSELAALAWGDLEDQADGIAVHVRRSKTNQGGSRPDTRFVKNGLAKSIRELCKLRAESGTANDDDSVFGLTPDAVGGSDQGNPGPRRHRLPRRVRSLVAPGPRNRASDSRASIADICESGGWQSPSMPVRYCAGITAANNAVARYL